MNLTEIIRKLRKAADTLEELTIVDTPTKAEAIRRAVFHKPRKKYKLKGKHWTQLPENREKISRAMKKLWKAKQRKAGK